MARYSRWRRETAKLSAKTASVTLCHTSSNDGALSFLCGSDGNLFMDAHGNANVSAAGTSSDAGVRPAFGDGWYEVILNQEATSTSLAHSVAVGHSILVLRDVASTAECAAIAAEASDAAQRERIARGLDGLVRKRVADLLSAEGTARCDALLLRQIARIESSVPLLVPNLFGALLRESPKSVFGNINLAWSEGEPAINVYTPGGCFTPHEDAQSITCLLNVSQQGAYQGGGTAFWSKASAGTGRDLTSTNPHTCLITPPAGTALVFGGMVTHAALAIVEGERTVFVASFSPVEPENMLIYGDAGERVGAEVAGRSGGTLIDLAMLLEFARREESDEAGAFVAAAERGEAVTLELALPMVRLVQLRSPPPYVFCGFPRGPAQVKALESAVGKLALAAIVGGVTSADDASLHAFFATNASRTCDVGDADGVLASMEQAGMRFLRRNRVPGAAGAHEAVAMEEEECSLEELCEALTGTEPECDYSTFSEPVTPLDSPTDSPRTPCTSP